MRNNSIIGFATTDPITKRTEAWTDLSFLLLIYIVVLQAPLDPIAKKIHWVEIKNITKNDRQK